MKVLDPKAAAEAIADHVDRAYAQKVDSGSRHEHAFILEVLKNLALDDSGPNIEQVSRLLAEHDIQPHQIQEYPKMLTEPDEKTGLAVPIYRKFPDGKPNKNDPVIVNSKEEEDAFVK